MTTLAIYEVPPAIRQLTDECPTCHGAEFVNVDTGEGCPDCGGNRLAVIDRYLEALREEDVERTVAHLAMRVDEYEAEAELLLDRAKKLADRARSRTNTADHIRKWIAMQMIANNVQKVKSPEATIYLQDSREVMEVVDESKVPAAHKRADLQMPLDEVPMELQQYVRRSTVLLTPLLAYLHETGEIPPGCEHRAKGYSQHLVVRR